MSLAVASPPYLIMSSNTIQAIFRTREQRVKTGDQTSLSLISPERLDILLRVVLTILAVLIMLVPILILFELQPSDPSQTKPRARYQLLTVFVFTLVFSASCSIFTKARRQEVFGATAAYCAVLVVFLGNSSSVIIVSNGS